PRPDAGVINFGGHGVAQVHQGHQVNGQGLQVVGGQLHQRTGQHGAVVGVPGGQQRQGVAGGGVGEHGYLSGGGDAQRRPQRLPGRLVVVRGPGGGTAGGVGPAAVHTGLAPVGEPVQRARRTQRARRARRSGQGLVGGGVAGPGRGRHLARAARGGLRRVGGQRGSQSGGVGPALGTVGGVPLGQGGGRQADL